MLDKTYQPAEIEPRIHAEWEEAQAFRAGRPDRKDGEPYCIVIPPPNVTGSLHMGHALNNTLQDVLCRFERMRGKDVLWQPGTDHAGIATQMVVERQLMERQEPNRRALGREKFVEKVWAWKEESGSAILNQLKRLGASCDWSRERFTMDEGLSKAVLKVFVDLYNAKLIYKDKRLVNWDPKFQTAISDLEVVQVEAKGTFNWTAGDPERPFDAKALAKVLDRNPSGHMYHFRYPLSAKVPGYDKDYIVVATTRPETMLGDTGVAVHPSDERYAALVKAKAKVKLPLVGREIPIVADEYSDPEKGSGAVKITPAHDFNDFEVGKRHSLAQINIFDENANLNQEVPEAYRGMERFAARKRIVSDLEALGLVEKIEPTGHTVPHGDRSNAVIEPWLTDQWYVNAAELAKAAIAAVENGKTTFVPKNWEKTYFEWMRNIQPWCISRQLWWGHQIPAWYGPDGKVFVADSEAEAQALAKKHYGSDTPLKRDEDVLDTWFSSALWPFSTLGWPDKTPELKRYYPTTVLVTGFDIIFFWVARMMMMGLYFMKEVPFHDVYIHALVRDEKGQKMSKSKGNVMDPLVLVDTYGADALRFTLAAMAAQGRDIKLSTSRVEGYRNFATKLWNASRFAEMNECVRKRGFDPAGVKQTINRWIVGETERAATAVTESIEAYKFNEAAAAIYEFVWGVFCDWYLELIKPTLLGRRRRGKDRGARDGRLDARPNPEALASVHALHHRGAVGAHGRARRAAREPAGALPVAEAVGAHGRGGRGGDRLGRASRERDPLRAHRDERAGGGQDPARASGRGRRLERARKEAPGDDQPARAPGKHHLPQGGTERRGGYRRRRHVGRAAACRRHRHGRGDEAARARDREGAGRSRQDGREALQPAVHGQGQGRGGRGGTRAQGGARRGS